MLHVKPGARISQDYAILRTALTLISVTALGFNNCFRLPEDITICYYFMYTDNNINKFLDSLTLVQCMQRT